MRDAGESRKRRGMRADAGSPKGVYTFRFQKTVEHFEHVWRQLFEKPKKKSA